MGPIVQLCGSRVGTQVTNALLKTVQAKPQTRINLTLKNAANQTILDKCRANPHEGTKQALEKLLREDFGLTTGNIYHIIKNFNYLA